jgi:multiple sugar transport system substrate-binding protein
MSSPFDRDILAHPLDRRALLRFGAAAGLTAAGLTRSGALAQSENTGVDPATWTPENIRAQAGTIEVNTAEDVAKVVPLDHAGKISFWYVGPTEATTELEKQIDADFWTAFKTTYPNIQIDIQNLDYNQMLDKVRTAALGKAAPAVAKMPILWGVEFAAKGQLSEIDLAEFNYVDADFWPGALKSVTWDGKRYGIPTNNETMALIWNRAIFQEAGLDPENPPATWDDLVAYSKQIKDTTGKAGYGLVARVNAGNTPFRFMPACWAYGGGAFDEAEPNPTYDKIYIGNEGTQAAVQAYYNMYVRDKSVPVAALTNTQTENRDPFVAGQLAMMISHPSEYAGVVEDASKATGDEKPVADAVVANMAYGLIPQGPARRSVVFGGSNIHIFNPDVVAGDHDRDAAKALIAFMTGPEWSTKLAWLGSNPGHISGFKTTWMKDRLDQIKFLDVTTSMLPYGVPFPVIPEATEVMNIVVPEMLQNALTEKMSVADACKDAESKIEDLRSGL